MDLGAQIKHRVIRVDLPGFGLTGPTQDGNHMPVYTHFVHALMEALHIERAVLGGNSFGGDMS